MSVQKTIIPNVSENFSLEAQLALGEKMKNGDMKAREKLILSVVPLVKNMANTPFCRYYSSFDDAFQDGMLAAVKAVDLYDYQRHIKFDTFAFKYIHQAILRGVVKRSPVKISERDFFNSILLNSTSESFQKTYQVLPTDEQLSKLTSIPINDIVLLRKRCLNKMLVSLDDDEAELLIPPGDISFIIDNALTKTCEQQRAAINEALQTLSSEEREIIEKRFLYADRKMTVRELSKLQGVSFQTISKREKIALKKLLLYFVENNIEFDDLV